MIKNDYERRRIMQYIKKVFSLLLVVTMLVSVCSTSTFAATIKDGTNGKTIYLSTSYSSDNKGENPITSVSQGDSFFVMVNFSGNPTSAVLDSMTAFGLYLEYDSDKMQPENKAPMLATGASININLLSNVIGATWSSTDGISERDDNDNIRIFASGSLYRIKMKALEDLDETELKSFKFLNSVTIDKSIRNAVINDGHNDEFTIVQAPAIELGKVEGEIYSDTTAEAIKGTIKSFSFIDVSGSITEYTNSDSEWADLTVSLPAEGLEVGKNILKASYDGYTCEFEVEVLDRVESIAVTTAPDKTIYTAFEKFDKAGMVVTATYESGDTKDVTADCIVDTTTELKVENTSWTITYSGKTTTQAITVNPKPITMPEASAAELVYTGQEQVFAFSAEVDEDYVSIIGEAKGKNVGTYNVTASLKDKANTVWATAVGGTEDVQLSWIIGKATITRGIAAITKKYTATYAELPSEVNITGVNSETVSATISWYTDADCTQTADRNAQIATFEDVDGEVALYYKATGMDNYNDYKGNVVVSVTDKDTGRIEWDTLPVGFTKTGDYAATVTYSENGYEINESMFAVKDKNGSPLVNEENITLSVNRLTDAGSYNIVVRYEDKDNKAEQEFTVVVNPKSIEGLKVSLKVGDGSAVETSSENPLLITYTGSEIAPVVTGVEGLVTGNYSVDGEGQDVTLAAKDVSDVAYLIAVNGTGNYTGTAYGYWNITPAEINVSAATVLDKVYNAATEDATITNVLFSGLKGEEALEKGVDYDIVSAVYADKNVGENVTVNVTVALKNTAKTKNYTLNAATVSTTGKITQAQASVLSAPVVQTLLSNAVVEGAKDYSFNLASVISGIPVDAGDVTYAVKTEGNFVKKIGSGIDGSVLKVNVEQPQEATVTDSVVITVSSVNYADADVAVNFEFKNKTTVEIVLSDVSATYGDAYTVAGSYANQPSDGYTWTYKYVGVDGTDYPASDIAPVNAGKYSITAYYEDNTPNGDIPGHIGEQSATLIISKKTLIIADGDVAVTKVYDETTDAGTLTGTLALSGILGDDEVYVDMTLADVSDYSAAGVGSYTVEIGGLKLGGADKDNYSIPEIYSFSNAKITKQLQSAVTINDSNEDIFVVYGDGEIDVVIGGGNGEGAYTLISSDDSILKLSAKNDNTWTAEILKAGTVTLTASKLGDSNYEASEELAVSFEIIPKDIVEGDFVIDLTDKVFTGSEIKPAVSSETLVTATDYNVVYSDNVNVGTATITITGKDNFKGQLSKTFAIAAKPLNETEFTVSGLVEGYTYTGEEIEPLVNIVWQNIDLVADTDYDIAYTNNTNAGTATVTFTGKGNYSGTLAQTYTINPAAYTGIVTISADQEAVVENTVLTANAAAGGELTYQWKRNGNNIDNATEITYTVTSDDRGAEISVVVTSTGNYVGQLESTAISVNKAILTGTVTLSGTTDITATVEEAPSEEHYTIVWLRNGTPISNISGTTYTVGNEDKGCEITVKLVAISVAYTGEVLSHNSILVPAEAPSFEHNPSASVGSGSITVSFGASANGAEITNYQIMVDGHVVATVDGNQTRYTISGLENGTQYTIKIVAINSVGSTESEEITATPRAYVAVGGGVSKSSYTITVKSSQGGTLATDIKKAEEGEIVTIKVTPDEGYELSELSVADKKGNKIAVTKNEDDYTFVMPKAAVTIDAKFTKADEEKEEDPDTVEFVDVNPTSYYYDAVKWALENNVTNGTSANVFSPDEVCTRAQIVTFLWRAVGSPKAQNSENPFTDIAKGEYYYDAVMWAVENGITSGVTATTFDPDGCANRAQTVTFLWRLAASPATETENPFGDVANDAYYNGAVTWAVKENITNGITATSFGPDDACTRAQIVTFIYRYFVK